MEKQLLDTFLDLYTYDTKIHEWSFEKFENFPSRFHRLQMITALMKALEINCSYSEFKEGRFISKVQFNKWKDFKESIIDQLDAKAYTRSLKENLHPFDIQSIFRTFMQYRLNAQKLLGVFDGIYAANEEFRAFIKLIEIPNIHLKEELKNIEHVLLFCINPNEIQYTQEELIIQFGFPAVDLRQIDSDIF
jgi:hypothetical protein